MELSSKPQQEPPERVRQGEGRLERLRVNGWHLDRVIKLRRDFRYGWRQGLAIEDGKDKEEALAEGAKRLIAFRNTYCARIKGFGQ